MRKFSFAFSGYPPLIWSPLVDSTRLTFSSSSLASHMVEPQASASCSTIPTCSRQACSHLKSCACLLLLPRTLGSPVSFCGWIFHVAWVLALTSLPQKRPLLNTRSRLPFPFSFTSLSFSAESWMISLDPSSSSLSLSSSVSYLLLSLSFEVLYQLLHCSFA